MNGLSARVAEELKKIGYTHVTVDLQGYRRGSLNEGKPGLTSLGREINPTSAAV